MEIPFNEDVPQNTIFFYLSISQAVYVLCLRSSTLIMTDIHVVPSSIKLNVQYILNYKEILFLKLYYY